MTRSRFLIIPFVAALLLGSYGCGGGGTGGASSSSGKAPKSLEVDSSAAKDLAVAADGGGAGVSTGEAYAAVYVPPGAAPEGATWKVTPLKSAPKGVSKPLTPGIWVDTAGKEPTDWCAIGFSIPGTAPADATIVKLADDGTVAKVIATTRLDYGDRTFLTAYVDGFSAYTTSEEDQAARDKTFTDQAQAKGQTPDWTIKVIGTEQQNVQGWKFDYELDMFASGGGIGQGGTYKGHAMLTVTGKYEDQSTAPYFTTMGDVNGIGRDQNLTFTMIEPPLASLLTGVGGDMPAADGVMNLEGMADLNLSAEGVQGEKGQVNENDVQSKDAVAFTLKVTTGEDVQVEIENVGIFPGKILRTAK